MPPVSTILFDYGNTLIAFGPDQQAAQSEAMTRVLADAGFSVDEEKLTSVRISQIMRPYHCGGVENVFVDVCREIVELVTDDTDGTLTQQLMQARQQAFRESVQVAPCVSELLNRLKQKYRLGFLSNYPCSTSIVTSLQQLGLHDLFDAVIVSGDVGFAKPHPRAYAALLDAMCIQPETAVYVGDNWLADVQGAKRAGLRAVWLREHVPYERFDPQPGDVEADAEIASLLELEQVLDSWI